MTDSWAGGRVKEPLLPAWLKVLLIILGVTFFGGFGVWKYFDVSTRDALEAELEQLRTLGWPTEASELAPEPIPDDANAALVWEDAAAKLASIDENVAFTEEELSIFQRVTDLNAWAALKREQQEMLRAYVTRYAAVLALLHQAAGMQECQFDIDHEMSFLGAPMTDVLERSESFELLRAATIVALADGRADEASEHCLDMLALAKHLEGHKLFMLELKRIRYVNVSAHTVEALVQSEDLAEAQLTQILEAMDGLEARQSFLEALKGELVSLRTVFALQRGEVSPLGAPAPRYALPARVFLAVIRPLVQHDEATALRLGREAITLTEQPYHQIKTQLDQWLTKVNSLSRLTPISAEFFPVFRLKAATSASAEARVAAARTGLALELYRRAHGDYPDTLEQLVPDIVSDVPLDPFDGKPLLYINDGERVVVYSMGEDLRDDGGSEDAGASRSPLDIVFTVRGAQRQAEEPEVRQ